MCEYIYNEEGALSETRVSDGSHCYIYSYDADGHVIARNTYYTATDELTHIAKIEWGEDYHKSELKEFYDGKLIEDTVTIYDDYGNILSIESRDRNQNLFYKETNTYSE